MNWRPFETALPGKWVLAGEHAVLRGATAIALPLLEFVTCLRFSPDSAGPLRVRPESARELVSELVASALSAFGKSGLAQLPSGLVEIESTIPIGAGLGSSAALCAAITRWIASAVRLGNSRELADVARTLEDRFHGKSSGMDVSVILAGQPVAFSMKSGIEPLKLGRVPLFTFHDTGLRAKTSECIAKVRRLSDTLPETAERLDRHMTEAAQLARSGLELYAETPHLALEQLAHAMTLAQTCYAGWGLVPPSVRDLEKRLLDEGALACKLTGAGSGGFLVALRK